MACEPNGWRTAPLTWRAAPLRRRAAPLRRRGGAVLLLLALACGAAPAVAGDPAADLKSADVLVRLAAVESLRTGPGDAEALLLQALGDPDWEVVEKAAAALGEKGGTESAKALAKLAADAPARRVRVLAARALAKRPNWADQAETLTRAKSDDLARALDVIAAVAETRESDVLAKAVERGLAARKEPTQRTAAARAIGVFPAAERLVRLQTLSADADSAVASAAVDAARAKPDDSFIPVFVEILGRPKTSECTARRARAALVEATRRRAKGDDAAKVVALSADALVKATAPDVAWQFARVLGETAEIPDEHVAHATLIDALGPALGSGSPKVRACAAWGLGRIGGDIAAGKAAQIAKDDADARVRLIAVQSLGRLRNASDDATFKLLCDRVVSDPDPLVREEAAVQLGRKGLAGTLPTLRVPIEKTMDDKKAQNWEVAVAALVSLGKTRHEEVVPYLIETAQKAKDWKVRGAALVGLGHVRDKRAVPVLLDAVAAKDPLLKAVATEFLRRAHPDGTKYREGDWKAWWEREGAAFRYVDREEEIRKAQKHGYAPDLTGVYEGLDVIVFQSRGDRIEELLAQLGIVHRLTRSGQVKDAGLHPLGIFVSNCTGEITRDDVDPIAWFVRTGGHFFGSCWSLNKTIELASPGCLRKYDLKGQVLADVIAEPCRPGSPFVEGVFQPLVRPIYVLEGAHLIDVVDPERAEVLMDSPWTEEKFGNGNLVAWFPLGHGVVLDSANHFELQGFAHAKTETSDEMIAHALDHLGLTYAEVRKIPPSSWKNKQDAGKAAKDLSCFRFLTNFVREKRKYGE